MRDPRPTWPALLLTLALALPALAVEPAEVFDSDRVEGVLPDGDSEVGLALEGLEGTRLDLEVVARRDAAFEPEVRIYGPDDLLLDIGLHRRHSVGSLRTRVRKLLLPETGRYEIVVTAHDGRPGAFRLMVRARHPVKIVARGEVGTAGGSVLLRFPAFDGTRVLSRVKGKDGLRPRVDRMLEPGVTERALPAPAGVGPVLRLDEIECDATGDYRLVVSGDEDTTGAWKGKVKLRHPTRAARVLEAVGEPAGTFTADKGVPTDPGGGGSGGGGDGGTGGLSFRIVARGAWSWIDAPERAVARTPAELQALWARHWPPTPELPTPDVDFSREIVAAVFLGRRATGGFEPRVVGVDRLGTGAVVRWYERTPGQDPVITAVTTPFVLVALTHVAGPVTFRETAELP